MIKKVSFLFWRNLFSSEQFLTNNQNHMQEFIWILCTQTNIINKFIFFLCVFVGFFSLTDWLNQWFIHQRFDHIIFEWITLIFFCQIQVKILFSESERARSINKTQKQKIYSVTDSFIRVTYGVWIMNFFLPEIQRNLCRWLCEKVWWPFFL